MKLKESTTCEIYGEDAIMMRPLHKSMDICETTVPDNFTETEDNMYCE